jgi:hypothetical protein
MEKEWYDKSYTHDALCIKQCIKFAMSDKLLYIKDKAITRRDI